MILQHIQIEHFGGVSCFEQQLTPGLNLLTTRYAPELVAALDILLCRKGPAIPTHWLRQDTRLTARVCLEEGAFTVTAAVEKGRLQLSAPECYRYTMDHSPEQDHLEHFNGADKTLPRQLYRYRHRPDPKLSRRTNSFTDTKLFCAYLHRYIRTFQPQPVNTPKEYHIALDPEGKFIPVIPGCPGKVSLSETEQKLFHYICFLNLAEFWADLETLRDLHHEKKPLLVYNFLEYLDESIDLQTILTRTQNLSRQTIFLATQETK